MELRTRPPGSATVPTRLKAVPPKVTELIVVASAEVDAVPPTTTDTNVSRFAPTPVLWAIVRLLALALPPLVVEDTVTVPLPPEPKSTLAFIGPWP